MKQAVLIFGATSAIAEHMARIWAKRGASLHLVARDATRLNDMAQDLRLRGASAVSFECADLRDGTRHATLIENGLKSLGGLDVVLLAHGILSSKAADLAANIQDMFDTNTVSVVSLMDHAAAILSERQGGTLAVIGSVAGDRGRASNGIYGATKAAVAAHASATRQRLARRGAWVVTLKPGLVDTPMTADFAKGPLWASPAVVAGAAVRAIDRRVATAYLPGFWRWIMLVIRLMPERIFLRTRF